MMSSSNNFSQSDVTDLQGRTAVVTGATVGIGFEVAKALAEAKARVLLLSRKEENGAEAVSAIKESASGPVDIEFISVDLGNLQQVKEVADRIRESESRLDILVEDAGVGVNKYDVSSDGIDRHFAVNHLGHFLLTNRLLPLIRKTADQHTSPAPRIVALSSELHRTAPGSTKFKSLDEINDPSLSANQLYSRSKLANMLFIKYGVEQRAIRPTGARIYANAVHPGAVHTGQQDQFKEAYGQIFGTIMKTVTVPFMRNAEQGSLCALWAATSNDIEKEHYQGMYFSDPGVMGKETSQGSDPELGTNLWNLSETIITEKLGKDALLPWDQSM